MTVKKAVRNVLNEVMYHFDTSKTETTIPSVDEARAFLEKYSPKPIGYCSSMQNKPIDLSLDLSIVIPMYNQEKYIEECLLSVINSKTQYSYEIVLIDDGSTDSSYDISQKIADEHTDKVIRIIRQENRGFSGARNRGIDESVGKYIMFVDSDDVIDENMVEVLMQQAYATGYDVVQSGFYIFTDDTDKRNFLESAVDCDGPAFDVMRKYPCYYWGKVYKREFWNDIRQPEGYYFEDMTVLFIITKLACGFSYVPKALYGYRQNKSGITAVAKAKPKSIDQLWITEYIEEEYSKRGWSLDTVYQKAMIRELGIFLLGRTVNLPTNVKKALFSLVCERVSRWDVKLNELSRSEKRFVKACQNVDYSNWQRAVKYFH